MADLRALVEDLGYADVHMLLNRGNVVFTAQRTTAGDSAARIQNGPATRTGVSAQVTVISAVELAAAVADNPLLGVADNSSRLLVAFLANPADRSRLMPLAKQE